MRNVFVMKSLGVAATALCIPVFAMLHAHTDAAPAAKKTEVAKISERYFPAEVGFVIKCLDYGPGDRGCKLSNMQFDKKSQLLVTTALGEWTVVHGTAGGITFWQQSGRNRVGEAEFDDRGKLTYPFSFPAQAEGALKAIVTALKP
jgi:hypothetical protein